ncbi:SelT/SelW/SelH family protein [Kluyveromyces lactis]|uniref:KLLA0D05841p n=1 Tax=Kluyveromyces lactis (strain ATCC 8585 / CBS 2359 / DSM 70799 / NBRC 1267 / NRRL Y-1140 / WM37) TaxID=284590 RepID=Q6CRW7_KLULA|nr:uncharacterized protein KLLA0_D05841g [Kluyveromyces lactis]CAH00418.1 KLLA0D05841p [Kluyveromyces lactis]|eukprot:XP_453322.1 uncharacterized protein KLLA0_D05841g [Kluyveromyces lactis]
MPFPKVSIVFCTKCKWNLRSAWYVQELLQTFGSELKEISLIPGEPGEFKVLGYQTEGSQPIVIWDRVVDDGFPDSKYLKQRVKALIFNDEVAIGAHIDRKSKSSSAKETLVSEKINQCSTDDQNTSCKDCET